jgi:glycosyltransferase involved in cell wall biosynthesis
LVNGYNDVGRLRIIRWCHRHQIPVMMWGDSNIRGDLARGVKARVKRMYLKHLIHRVDAVLPCGRLGKEYFQKYGADPTRMFFMPYEPDYSLIQQLPNEAVDSARGRFGLDPMRRRIVFSGRLIDVKRPDMLVDAFIRIAGQRPDWDLLIIGDGSMKAELERRVPAELSKRVIWTGFLNDQSAISALYRSSDVLALPSSYEPWALVINEAVAAGLAVVSSDVVGAAWELVRDGVNGRTFPPGDLNKLVYCLQDVTTSGRTDVMKAASAQVLADWRRTGDPVDGLRRALNACGILTAN